MNSQDSRLFSKTVEVRNTRYGNMHLRQEDLDAESKYQNTRKDPQELNPRIQDLKNRNFTSRESYDLKNLSNEEKEVFCRINPVAGINGAKLVEIFKQNGDVMKPLLAMGMAFAAGTILYYEEIMNQLPELLDSLVKKGALLEQPSLSNEPPSPKR